MKCSELLASVLLVCVQAMVSAAEPSTGAASARFAPLDRPAQSVKAPARAVLLAGMALPDGRLIGVGERGVVVLSDDGGGHWRQAKVVPTSVTLTAVRMAPSGEAFAVGHGGVVLKSADRGEHWDKLLDGRQLAALAMNASQALRETGRTDLARIQRDAQQLSSDGPDKPLTDIAFQDARRGIVVGAYNLAFVTEDGGANWRSIMDRVENPKALHLYAAAIQGDTWMLAGEQGTLLRSQDGGSSFARLNSPYQGSWFALTVGGPGEWYLAGLRGHAFFSSDDGQTWQPIDGAPPASFVAAARQSDGSVMLTSQAGLIFKASRTATLKPVNAQPLPPLAQVIPLKDGATVALGFAGAIRLERVGR
jgi:photosystem II stability/assembly factor-like uncharacterized protein